MTERKRSPIVFWIIPLIIGLGGLNRVMSSPSYDTYRGVDVVQLLGSGACFGATMAGLISSIKRRRQ